MSAFTYYTYAGEHVAEPDADLGLFNTELQIEVGAVVTHPPGTTYDEDGNPIPPKDDDN